MTADLEAFLRAEDLDAVLAARRKITELSPVDESSIRAIIAAWRDAQAVSNLLFHPDLIPADLRLPTLLRGLAERQVVYYVLAAVVGLQGLDPSGLADGERTRVLSELVSLIRETTDVLARRASVSFHAFAGPADASEVFALLEHADETVRHNVRAWLFSTFQSIGMEQLATAAHRSGVAPEVQQRTVEEFSDFVANPPQGFESPLLSLFGYIPNLRDVGQNA